MISDPINYSEPILGRDPNAYATWIKTKNSWGGAIELAIFSSYFKTGITSVYEFKFENIEIASIDIATLQVDLFGQENNYSDRIIVLYSGIHYDAVALSPLESGPLEFDQTKFNVNDTYKDPSSKN